jgi:hypothetical integral membrane protein (TIGR02206 family)
MFFGLESSLEPNMFSRLFPFLLLGAGLYFIVRYKEKINKFKYEKIFIYTWVILVVILELWFWRWQFIYNSNREIHTLLIENTMIPLHLCAMAFWLSVITAITKNKTLFRFTLFIGILGPLITFLAGEVAYSFDHLRYWHFYLQHISTFLLVIYMHQVLGLRIQKGDWIKMLGVMIVFSIIIVPLNAMTGTNFMYLYNGIDSPLEGMHWILNYVALFLATAISFRITEKIFGGYND